LTTEKCKVNIYVCNNVHVPLIAPLFAIDWLRT